MGARWRYLLKSTLKRRDNWIFIPIVIIIFILLIYSLSSIFLTSPSTPQLSIYSDKWGDLSKCRADMIKNNYQVTSIISTPTVLSKFHEDDYKNMVYMAIGVERPYSKDDSNQLWSFIRQGGNVVIADDFGYGNTFWDSDYNEDYFKAKFNKHQLFDPNYMKNTTFVIVPATLPGINIYYDLLLNEPSALELISNTRTSYILAESSSESWLDWNGNRVRDPTEPKGKYPIILYSYLSTNSGKIIVISDPGMFINENWDRLDNAKFVLDMLSILIPDGGRVIFDESRHISDNTFENTRRTLYSGLVYLTSTPLSIILIVILIISFTIIIGAKIKPQRPWKNDNLLNKEFFNILNNPYISPNDFWQIYNTFLEKVRLTYDFAPDEFRNLDEATLYNLISDDYLWDFITGRFPFYADSRYYTFIVDRILTWKPRSPDQIQEPEQDEYYETFEVINDYQPEFQPEPTYLDEDSPQEVEPLDDDGWRY